LAKIFFIALAAAAHAVTAFAEAIMHNEMQAVPQQMQRLIGSSNWNTDDVAIDWQPIDTAPFGEDLHLSVIENGEVHSLVFPCRRTKNGWLHSLTSNDVPVHPTHWRHWLGTS
jgi:hypothetical protein